MAYVERRTPTLGAVLRWGVPLVVGPALAASFDPLLAAVLPLAWLTSLRLAEGELGAVRVGGGRMRCGLVEVAARDVVGVEELRGTDLRAARRDFGDWDRRRHCPSWMPSAVLLQIVSPEGLRGRLLVGTRNPVGLRLALQRGAEAPSPAVRAAGEDAIDARAGVGAIPGTWGLVGFLALLAAGSANNGGEDIALAIVLGLPALVAFTALRRVRVDRDGLRFGSIDIRRSRIRSVRATTYGEAVVLAAGLPAAVGRVRLPSWPPPRALVVTTHPDGGRAFEQLDEGERGRLVYVLACRPADRAAAALQGKSVRDRSEQPPAS